MHQFLKDTADGQELCSFYLCKNYTTQKKADGRDYFRVDIADKSGECHGVCWEDPKNFDVGHKSIGKIIKVKGTMGLYRDVPQIRVFNIRDVKEADFEQFDVGDIIESAPIDAEACTQDVVSMIDSIADEEYRAVAEAFFEKTKDKFTTIPAGKVVHHSFRQGLLMHTSNMMKLACDVSKLYENVIDRDLLLTATFLHDLAKIEEFDLSELGLVSDYSKAGQLLGHLYIGAVNVEKVCEKLGVDESKSLMLQHLILSHHGEPEKGAAIQPKCPEAEALHIIDLMDSRLEMYAEEFAQLEPGQFTQKKNWALDHRVYRNK